MSVTINASTSSGLVQTADTSGTIELQSNGTTKLSVLSTGVSGVITAGTAVASTSGTSIDFTSIPSWVKRITVMFNGVSTNGTSELLVQLGTISGVENTGYVCVSGRTAVSGSVGGATYTTGIGLYINASADTHSGNLTFTNLSGNIWTVNGAVTYGTTGIIYSAGSKTTSATLDRVRITTVNGTDTFDAGSINILYEG